MLVALRALKLGDLLTGVPALRALTRAHPHHERLLAAPAWLEPLVALADTGFELVGTEALAPLPRRLHGADVAVNLHGRGPQSTSLLAATGPRRLVAFDTGPAAPRWRPEEHEVARWCRLLLASGIPADPTDLRIRPPDAGPPDVARGATVVHPGASTCARRWPAERFAAVARAERDAGRPVVVTGDASEIGLAEEVAARAALHPRSVLAGRTDLVGLVATVAAAARVVCGDTGIAHVASALGTPSVVLFGPVSPARWGPPAGGPHVSLWAGGAGDPHAQAVDAGLLAIPVDAVLAALASLPDTGA